MRTPSVFGRRRNSWRKSLCLLALCFEPARAALAAPAGSLDPAFSGDGITVTPIGTSDLPRDVAVQADGRIVVVGTVSGGLLGLARYLSTGALDPSFGTGGIVTTAVPGSSFSNANGCAIQGDGKIVLAGNTNVAGTPRVLLARYLATGALDPSFGTGGIVTTPLGAAAAADSLAIAPDGKLVIAGYVSNATDDVLVARYLASGAPDPAFGSGGVVSTPVGTLGDYGEGLAVQSDGRIVVGGEREVAVESYEGMLLRYTTAGALDATFGLGGIRSTPFGVQSAVRGVALQADGRIVVTGRNDNGGGSDDFVVARYTAGGSPDVTFGTIGVTVTPIGSGTDQAFDLALQGDGKAVLVGRAEIGAGANLQLALARYTTAGGLDPTFGSGGIVTTPIGAESDTGRGVAIGNNGKIVVVGSTDSGANTSWFAARYLSVDSSIPLLGPGARAALAVTLLATLALALRRRKRSE